MSQNIRAVEGVSPRHGRIWNVDGSGLASMSDSCTRAKPSIDDPSKPMPSLNAPSSSAGAMATDFSEPSTSVNHRRTKRTSRSSSARRTKSSCLPMGSVSHADCYGSVSSASDGYAGGVPQLRLALAQVNARVGDLEGNAELVLASCREAADRDAHLVVLPEMVLTGYPIEDMAYRASFIAASQQAAPELAKRLQDEGLGDLVVIVGHLDSAKPASLQRIPDKLGTPKNAPTNSASVIHSGRVVTRYDKHHLPNYGVFDEFRHFVPGDETQVVQVGGVDIALAICEDIWQDGPSEAARAAEAGLLIVINGSPYEAAKDDARLELCARRAREGGCALAYVNLVGGQDELVFEGDSMVVGSDGEMIARA